MPYSLATDLIQVEFNEEGRENDRFLRPITNANTKNATISQLLKESATRLRAKNRKGSMQSANHTAYAPRNSGVTAGCKRPDSSAAPTTSAKPIAESRSHSLTMVRELIASTLERGQRETQPSPQVATSNGRA